MAWPNSFKGQQENEKILFFSHQHWLIFLWSTIKILILSALLVFTGIGISFIVPFKMAYGIAAGGVISVLVFLVVWSIKYKNFLIITNQRVLISIQKDLFHNEMRSVNLSKVKESAYKLDQFLGNIFGYGTIIIQSDVELNDKKTTFSNLPHVQDAKFFLDKIVNLVETNTEKDKFPMFVNKKKGQRGNQEKILSPPS